MTTLDGSSGVVPGVLPPGASDTFTLPSCTRIEVLNEGPGRLHVAINPVGGVIVGFTPGVQFVRPTESTEISVSGTPTVVVKADSAEASIFQVRVIV